MAVTVDSSHRTVFGNRRALLAQVDIGADADTYVTGFTSIDFWVARAADETAIGGTTSGGTITFQTGGAASNVGLLVIGI